MTDTRPITFVGGLHRSGTTLFADLLARHSLLSGHENRGFGENEGQYTQDVLPTEDEFHGPGRLAFYPAYREAMNAPTFDQAAARLRTSWHGFWPAQAEHLIEKTPGNLLRAPLLKKIFPTAKFIFLIRHPIATSLATQKWSHTGVFSLIAHWLAAYDLLLQYEHQEIDHVLVSYEDFLQRPEMVVDACFDHIGVSPEPIALPRLSNANVRYFDKWNQHFLKRREHTTEYSVLKERNESLGGRLVRALLQQAKKFENRLHDIGFQFTIGEREATDARAWFEDRVARFGYSLVDVAQFPRSHVYRAGQGRAIIEARLPAPIRPQPALAPQPDAAKGERVICNLLTTP